MYGWVEDNGYLLEVIGGPKYLALTGLDYDDPEKSRLIHKDIDDDTSNHDPA